MMAYPTITNLKAFLGVSGSGDDTNLTTALSGAIALFEKKTGRTFVAAADTKYFSVRKYVTMKGRRLSLFTDLCTITTLTNGDGVVVAATDYELVPLSAPYYEIWLNKSSGLYFWDGGDDTKISIVGTWGYSTDVPDDVAMAVLQLAKYLYNASKVTAGAVQATGRASGLTIPKQEMPKFTREIIEMYARKAV